MRCNRKNCTFAPDLGQCPEGLSHELKLTEYQLITDMKIVTILGARPQFIKAAAVSCALSRHDGIREVIVHTGQHFDREMSQLFFEEMHLPEPAYQLGIHGLPHGALTGRMMERIEAVLMDERPDWVLVYGDTDSTLAGAIAAKKLHLRVAHVEAGLRSFNEAMPEEINRILTDRVSDLLFCPSETAANHLHDEGRLSDGARILLSGDVMKDAARRFSPLMKAPATPLPDRYILCTFHRAENVDNPQVLKQLLAALEEVCETVPVVCPLHPHTRKSMEAAGHPVEESPIRFIRPVGYLEMLHLLSHSALDPKGRSGHYLNFLKAVKGEETANSDFAVAGPLSQVMALGALAQRLAAPVLTFDREKQRFTDSDAANALLDGPPARKGWEEFERL